MVISFHESPETKKVVVEMDLDDFVNLTNLISETVAAQEGEGALSSFPSPKMPPEWTNSNANATATLATPAMMALLSQWRGLAFESGFANDAAATEAALYEMSFLAVVVTLALALVLPNAVYFYKLYEHPSANHRGPLRALVHNRAGFWSDESWTPNTYFYSQGKKEEWAMNLLVPSVTVLGAGSWIVYLACRANKRSAIPINFTTLLYAAFLATHWTHCWTRDLNLGLMMRIAGTGELFLGFFAFKSSSFLASLTVIPTFLLYGYMTGVTYKTRMRWRKIRNAVEGYDEEIEFFEQLTGRNANEQLTDHNAKQPPTGHNDNQPHTGHKDNQPRTGHKDNQPHTDQKDNQPHTGHKDNQPHTDQKDSQPHTDQKDNQPHTGHKDNQPHKSHKANEQLTAHNANNSAGSGRRGRICSSGFLSARGSGISRGGSWLTRPRTSLWYREEARRRGVNIAGSNIDIEDVD